MPRTKRPAKKQEKAVEHDDLKKLDKLVLEQRKKIDARIQMETRNIEVAFKILLGSISGTYMQKTVGELKTELCLKEAPIARTTTHTSRSASRDDGYLTGNSSHGSEGRADTKQLASSLSSSRATGRRSRSADASCRKPPYTTASRMTQRRLSKSVYRTPAYNKNAAVSYPAITPKVNPQTPLTVLRQPRQGEMVVSMSGSPVMVPTCYTMKPDEMANCNILLRDGTMLSLQPKQLRQSQAYIPFSLMDNNVLQQLKTLQENLDKVVKLGEKVMK